MGRKIRKKNKWEKTETENNNKEQGGGGAKKLQKKLSDGEGFGGKRNETRNGRYVFPHFLLLFFCTLPFFIFPSFCQLFVFLFIYFFFSPNVAVAVMSFFIFIFPLATFLRQPPILPSSTPSLHCLQAVERNKIK